MQETKFNYFQNQSKSIIKIPFDELTEQDISYLNEFHLQRKRTYCNLSGLICEYSNDIINYSGDSNLLYKYLVMRIKIAETADYDLNTYIIDLYEMIDDSLVNAIDSLVETRYDINLDSTVKSNKQKNDSLMFTDAHCKLLLKISLLQKYLIPITMEYLHHNYSNIITKEYKVDNFLLDVFEPLLESTYFNKDGKINILHKLYEYVKSRVQATNYSDKLLWAYYEYQGESSFICMETFTKKLITDAIPKFTIDGNIVNLIHAIIKKSLENYFRNNYPVNYKTLDLSKENEDLSSFDKMEINNAKIDESEIVLNNNNLKLTIKKLLKDNEIKISKEEFKFYSDNIKFNSLQKNLLFLFFGKDFKGQKSLYNCNRKEYIILLIILKRRLEKTNFKVLQYLILGNTINKINEKKTINKKQLYKIIETEKYQVIVTEKFSYVSNLIFNSKVIEKMIATLLNNKFSLVDFEEKENLGEEIKYNIDLLSEEILCFLERI